MHEPSIASAGSRRERRLAARRQFERRRRIAGRSTVAVGALAIGLAVPQFGEVQLASAATVTGVVNTYQAVSAISGTTATSAVVPAPWDGATGGVVSISGDDLVLDADIDASGTGFTTANHAQVARTGTGPDGPPIGRDRGQS